MHAILCERLRTIYERAQIIATEERMYQSSRNNSTATALRLKPKSEIKVEDFYSTFLDMLKNVLDGNMEASNFEDSLREMFGIHAYIAFTLDRVMNALNNYPCWTCELRFVFFVNRLYKMPFDSCSTV